MKSSRTREQRSLLPIGILILAAAAAAQVSSRDVVIAERQSLTHPLGTVKLVDYATSKARDLGNLSPTNSGHITVALDPRRPGELWGQSTRRVSFWTPIEHYILKGEAIQGTGSGHGDHQLSGYTRRHHVWNGDLLFTLWATASTQGVYLRDRKDRFSKNMIRLTDIADAYDIATLGDRIYVTTLPAVGASSLWEIDMSGTAPTSRRLSFVLDPAAKKNGAKIPTSFFAICAKGMEGIATRLMLVDTTGVIYEVVPGQTTWNITTNQKKGIAPPVAIAWHSDPAVGLVVATKHMVYDQANYTGSSPRPFYYTSNLILDLALDLGGVQRHGVGCTGSNGKAPRMVDGGACYQGNTTFSLRMIDGPPSAPSRVVVGSSNTSWLGTPLPLDLKVIGAPGCFLYTDILIELLLKLDATGAGSVPASIPVHGSLIGVRVFAQFGCADPGANPTGLTTSDMLDFVIR